MVQRGTRGDNTVGTDSFMIVRARAANFDASFTFPITTFFSGATAPISLNICNNHIQFFYATADEADAYMFYRCFFVFFPFATKNTRQPFSGTAEQIFMKLLPNDSGENGVCTRTQMWARPPINFLWAKNYTLRTWW